MSQLIDGIGPIIKGFLFSFTNSVAANDLLNLLACLIGETKRLACICRNLQQGTVADASNRTDAIFNLFL